MLSLVTLLVFFCLEDCLASGAEWNPTISKKKLTSANRIVPCFEEPREIDENPSVILLAGGRNGRHVELISTDPNMPCNKVMARLPIPRTKYGIGLIDSDGRPLICAGDLGQSCYAYDKDNNVWTEFNSSLPEPSQRAYAIQLSNKNYLILGEQRPPYRNTLAFYQRFDGQSFLEPVEMKKIGIKNLCASYSPWSGAVYIISGKIMLRFTFEEQFVRLTDNPVRILHRACGVVQAEDGSDNFVVVGGLELVHITRDLYRPEEANTTYIFHSKNGTWTQGQDYPMAMFAASSVFYQNTFVVIGGIRRFSGSHKTHPLPDIYRYEPNNGSWVDTGLRMKLKKEPIALIGNYADLCG